MIRIMPLKKMKVLLIEGEKNSALYIMSLLDKFKCAEFEIVHKTTMADSVECAESEQEFDLILLDLILPNSKGIHAFEAIKNIEKCHNVPIIIISDVDDIGVECVKKGAQDFIPKEGLSLSTLLRSMRYAIERRKKEIELEKIQERLKMALNATSDGIWDYDLDTNHVYISDRYEKLLGYESGSLSGSIEKLLDIMHPDDRERLVNKNMMSFDNKETNTYNDNVFRDEFRLKNVSGEYKWFLVRSMCVDNCNDGIPSRFVGVLVDITSRKMNEISHKESFDNLSSVLEERLEQWNQEIKSEKVKEDVKLNMITNTIVELTRISK